MCSHANENHCDFEKKLFKSVVLLLVAYFVKLKESKLQYVLFLQF